MALLFARYAQKTWASSTPLDAKNIMKHISTRMKHYGTLMFNLNRVLNGKIAFPVIMRTTCFGTPHSLSHLPPTIRLVIYFALAIKYSNDYYVIGLISLLKKGLDKSHSEGKTIRGVVCHPGIVHIHREAWDSSWGCGYVCFTLDRVHNSSNS